MGRGRPKSTNPKKMVGIMLTHEEKITLQNYAASWGVSLAQAVVRFINSIALAGYYGEKLKDKPDFEDIANLLQQLGKKPQTEDTSNDTTSTQANKEAKDTEEKTETPEERARRLFKVRGQTALETRRNNEAKAEREQMQQTGQRREAQSRVKTYKTFGWPKQHKGMINDKCAVIKVRSALIPDWKHKTKNATYLEKHKVWIIPEGEESVQAAKDADVNFWPTQYQFFNGAEPLTRRERDNYAKDISLLYSKEA